MRELRLLIFFLLFLGIVCFFSIRNIFSPHIVDAKNTIFVKRGGSNLFINGLPFRFAGANIYWLSLDENVNGVNYPTQFRIDDVLDTAKNMGTTVIRSWAISVGCSLCIEPSLNNFNDQGFQTLDYAIKAATDRNIRLILSLTTNSRVYFGSRQTFTDWRQLPEDSFFINSTVIGDYEKYISHILNHVNPYTGIAYKNDPTIMAWETGNELASSSVWPSAWTKTIASYIKTISSQQMVADGHSASSYPYTYVDDKSLGFSNVDLFSGHYYPMDTTKLSQDVNQVTAKNKVYFVGEFDWANTSGGGDLSSFLSQIKGSNVAGDLYWSLFAHLDTYGYVQHSDGFTLHYPGDTQDMAQRAQKLRNHAYTMIGQAIPKDTQPKAPYLHQVTDVGGGYSVAWRGVSTGSTYQIDRSSDGLTWQTLINGQTDNNSPWVATTTSTFPYYYRITAFNLNGVNGPVSQKIRSTLEKVRNGSFEYAPYANWRSFWDINLINGAQATIARDTQTYADGGISARVDITNTGGTYWYIQLIQRNISFTKNIGHTITFWAKAASSRQGNITIQQTESPGTVYFNQTFNINTNWQKYTFSFIPTDNISNALLEFNLGQSLSSIWFDGVSITP